MEHCDRKSTGRHRCASLRCAGQWHTGSADYAFARSMYSPVRVSTLIRSPISTKAGQVISAPVSSLAGLVRFVAVLPRTAGSQYSTLSTMWFGGSTLIGLLLNSIILQTVPSLIHFQVSSTCGLVNSYCSNDP